jgi:hypothetical protein
MKLQANNQEILLFTGTSFSNRPLCQKDTDDNEGRNYSAMEELEQACWDGMLNELLPELVGSSSNKNNNYIWNTMSGVHFLCISMGPCPMPVEKETSINPYAFLMMLVKAN